MAVTRYQGLTATDEHSNLIRESIKRKVHELLEYAGADDWDGDGALALAANTVEIAQKLVDSFPIEIGAPDIAATPHGEVDFDWIIDQDIMLTVSVGPSNEVTFAGLFRGARLDGSEPWKGTVPHFVHCCFERLREAQNT